MDKKMQVFISSTYRDLIEERQAAIEAVLETGNIPAGMELFTASNETQLTTITRWIDESDIFIMIIGGKFGAMEADNNMGYLQLEYLMARKLNKPIFVVQLSDEMLTSKVNSGNFSYDEVFEVNNLKLLNKFKRVLLTDRLVLTVNNVNELKFQLIRFLADTGNHLRLNGWIRAEESNFVQEIKRLQLELEKEKSKQEILIRQTNRPLPESRQNRLGLFTYEEILYALTSRTADLNEKDAKEFGFKNQYPTLLEVLMEHHMTLSRGITHMTSNSLDEMLKKELTPVLHALDMVEDTQQMMGEYPIEKTKLTKNGLTLIGKIYSGVFEEIVF